MNNSPLPKMRISIKLLYHLIEIDYIINIFLKDTQ